MSRIPFEQSNLNRVLSLFQNIPLPLRPLRPCHASPKTSCLRSFWRGSLGKDEAEANAAEPVVGVVVDPERHTTVPRAVAPATAAQHAG